MITINLYSADGSFLAVPLPMMDTDELDTDEAHRYAILACVNALNDENA